MNEKEKQIIEYLEKLNVDITDPLIKQEQYYDSHKLNLKHVESKTSLDNSTIDSPNQMNLEFHTPQIQSCRFKSTLLIRRPQWKTMCLYNYNHHEQCQTQQEI